jgi:uncharacterized membrane protein YdjX (TVP38/TMEM64 family)
MEIAVMRDMKKIRRVLVVLWLLIVAVGFYLYWLQPGFLEHRIRQALGVSVWFGYALYLLLGCLRGFTLIPSTPLIVLGLLFFAPGPLWILTMAGILVSATSVYYFSDFLQLDDYFERHHVRRIARVKSILQRHELPIIVAWSFAPMLSTDIICYVCGALEVNFKKFLLGVCIGEGIICALYIFGAQYFL